MKISSKYSYIRTMLAIISLLIFLVASVHAAWKLLLAKMGQDQGAPFIVGHDITLSMKIAIISSAFLCGCMLWIVWPQICERIRRNKNLLWCILIAVVGQTLLSLDYVAKLYLLSNSGLRAKILVIMGFTAINFILFCKFFLMNLVQKKVYFREIYNSLSICNKYDFENIWEKYRKDVYTFLISLVTVIFIYGNKLFFISYATDDYQRFGVTGLWWGQAAGLGRWANSILNHFIFSGVAHIQPYINTLISLFCIVLSAWLTIKIWRVENRKFQFILISLISISPYFARNLFFNTNTPVFVGLAIGIISLYLLTLKMKYIPISIVFNAFAIGAYQTILQVQLIILLIWLTQRIQERKDFKKSFFYFSIWGAIILVSYLLSTEINNFIVTIKGFTLGGRFGDANQIELLDILKNLIGIILNNRLLFFPSPELDLFWVSHIFLSNILLGLVILYFLKISSFSMLRFIIIVLMIKLAIYLPNLLGLGVPIRAYFHIGWVLAGLLALLRSSQYRIFLWGGNILAVAIILVSSVYVSHFFDAAYRQTQNDLANASQIVNRIRILEEYQSEQEPLPFLIIGRRSYGVKGWTDWYQALNDDVAKYTIFRHFTDFNFRQLSEEEEVEILKILASKKDIINYPGRDSIQFIDGTVVLILNTAEIEKQVLQMEN